VIFLKDSYPFLDVFWTILVIVLWVIWFWILISVFADLFRRRDIGGGAKVLWCIFVILLPYLGVFIYLLVNHQGIADRNVRQAARSQEEFDTYVRSVASSGGGGAAVEIERAKQLLDSGAITPDEFERSKAKALSQ